MSQKATFFICHILSRASSHNITQLLGCVLWDNVSHEDSYALILEFFVYEEHLGCFMWTFQQEIVDYRSVFITAFSFGKRPSCSSLIMLCDIVFIHYVFFVFFFLKKKTSFQLLHSMFKMPLPHCVARLPCCKMPTEEEGELREGEGENDDYCCEVIITSNCVTMCGSGASF